jgi:hypothetical protein
MPNLYGNPTKDAIRAQKRELQKALNHEIVESRNLRRALRFERTKREELEKKLEQFAQKALELHAEASGKELQPIPEKKPILGYKNSTVMYPRPPQ